MKGEINNAVSSIYKRNEIALFRAMACSLQRNRARAAFIQETHGRRGWVSFTSTLTGKRETKEIADLLILCKCKKDIKLSFLQAKYHRGTTSPFLKFNGDYLQLELLKNRPYIGVNNYFGLPANILNFSLYKSLTTYGIFYHDGYGKIDLLYTIADYLGRIGMKKRGSIIFPGNMACPQSGCYKGTRRELFATCGIDLYEKALLTLRVGAPIMRAPTISLSMRNILNRAIVSGQNNDNRGLLEEFAHALHYDNAGSDVLNSNRDSRGYPNILLVEST